MLKFLKSKYFYLPLIVCCGMIVGYKLKFSADADGERHAASKPRNFKVENRAPEDHGTKETADLKIKDTKIAERDPLTPDRARDLISEFYSKNSDVTERAAFCSKIIRNLCKNGYSAEAWELIDKGQGTVRNWGLVAFFYEADLPAGDLLAKMSQPDMEADLGDSFTGFMGRYKLEELEDILASPELMRFRQGLGKNEELLSIGNVVSSSLKRAMVSNPDQHGKFLEIAKSLNSKGLLSSQDFISVFNSKKMGNAFERWELFGNIKPDGDNPEVLNKQRNVLIDEMVNSNAPRTIEQLLKTGGDPSAGISAALDEWTNIDSVGASNWYTQNQARLTQKEREYFASSFSEIASRSREFENARLWAEQIQDEEKKKRALKIIDEGIIRVQKSTNK